MLLKQILILLVSISLSGLITIPAIAVENDLGLWAPIWVTLPVTKKIGTLLEISPRTQDNVTRFDQLFIRPAISYHLSDKLSVWQGYSWDPTFKPFNVEQRIWQQIQINEKFEHFNLESRFRLEERFINHISGVPVRGRYRLGYWIPIDKEKKWNFVLWDEVWFNFNSRPHGPQAGYDRNWLFAGINKKISDNVNLEGGYMFQYINSVSPKQDLLNHIILVNLYINLPQIVRAK